MADEQEPRLDQATELLLDGYLEYIREYVISAAMRDKGVHSPGSLTSMDIIDHLPAADHSPTTSSELKTAAKLFEANARRAVQRRRLRILLMAYAIGGMIAAIVALFISVESSGAPEPPIGWAFIAGVTGLLVALLATLVSFYMARSEKQASRWPLPWVENSAPNAASVASFLRAWNGLENAVRLYADPGSSDSRAVGLRSAVSSVARTKLPDLEKDAFASDFFALLAMRNDLVHGERDFRTDELIEASERILKLWRQLHDSHTP